MDFGTGYRNEVSKIRAPQDASESPAHLSPCNSTPLLLPFMAYLTGVAGVAVFELPNLPFLHISALLLFFYLLYLKRPTAFLVISTALVWGGIAGWNTLSPNPYHSSLIHEIENQQIVLDGQVLQVEIQPQRWRMDMQLNTIRMGERRLDARQMRGRIHVGAGTPSVFPGDHVYLRTRLREPRPFGTPGEFDYKRYLLRKRIMASGFIPDGGTIARMAPEHPVPISARIARWRVRTGMAIAEFLPPDSAAYVLSLALGEKTRLSPGQRETLAFTGLSHLFSISGLHLGMIAACVYVIIQWIYRRSTTMLLWQPVQKITPLLCLPVVVVYLFLSGGALPTLRATVMLGVAALLALINYRTRPISILLLAAALILIADPLAFQSASFQLSFAGVGALLLVLPVWHRRLKPGWKRPVILLFLTSYTACLATAPFALWHFHTLAPAGVINNLFAVPMVSFIILPLTLGATLLFSYAPQLSQPLLELSASLITRIIQWSKSFAAGPLAGEYVYLCIWEFAAFTFACAGLVLWGARRRNPGLACLSAAAVLLIFGIYAHDRESTLRLSALSIGQADSFIIQTPENKNYLVDGGGLYSDSFDTGSQLIAPALQRLGITSLDAVILTHDHPDHSKGLQHILRYFPTKAFMSGIRLRDLNPELREVLDHPEAPAQSTLPEGLIALDEYIYLHVPKQNHPEVNERSIAVFGGYGTEGFLLTGDLEREGMARLFKIEPPTPVTLFKLPHHGSRNSLPGRWLQTWDIHQALVSCGRFNRFGFPHTHICDLLENAGIPLWRTDTHGTLNFSTDGSGWVTKTHPTVRTNP